MFHLDLLIRKCIRWSELSPVDVEGQVTSLVQLGLLLLADGNAGPLGLHGVLYAVVQLILLKRQVSYLKRVKLQCEQARSQSKPDISSSVT